MTIQPLRPDLQLMADLIPEGSSVLDIGCGKGELLAWLKQHKQVRARGIEQQVERVNHCISQGLAVTQADAEQELPYFAENAFDITILSRTLQAMNDPVAMLNHVTRTGKQAIISIPNFGYWRNRLHLGLTGHMPVTRTLRYEWYDTPNIHFCTIRDFLELCQKQEIEIINQVFHNAEGRKRGYLGSVGLANLWAEQATFLVRKR
jgi:methionine biosynthesis protein MetW